MTPELILKQFPRHIRERHEVFVAFVAAYYEWLQNNKIDTHNIRDIDLTLDEFIRELMREVATSLPQEDVIVDKRLLLKNIHDLYTAKGSPNSFKLLFRIMYDIDADLAYPSRRLLRPSDGRWNVRKQLLLKHISGPIEDLNDVTLFVDDLNYASIINPVSITDSTYGDLWICQVVVESSAGILESGQIISTRTGSVLETQFEVMMQPDLFVIENGGNHYAVADTITVYGLDTEIQGRVTKVTPGHYKGPAVFEYKADSGKVIIEFEDFHELPANAIIQATFDRVVPAGTYVVTQKISPKIIEIQSVMEAAPTNETGKVEVMDITNAGKITEVQWVNKEGVVVREADIMRAQITSALGRGAKLSVSRATVATFDQGYIDVRGHLSERHMVLHDGKMFQAYSYIVRVSESVNTWRNVVKKILHPAGMYMIAELYHLVILPAAIRGVKNLTEILVRIKAKVTPVSSSVQTHIVSSILCNTASGNIKQLAKHMPTTMPLLAARIKYDTDALYTGDTGANYTRTTNSNYWYIPLFEEQLIASNEDIPAFTNSYTGVIQTLPPLTRWAEFFSEDIISTSTDYYVIKPQLHIHGVWDFVHCTPANLIIPTRPRRINQQGLAENNISDVVSRSALGSRAAGQVGAGFRIRTHNSVESCVKIHFESNPNLSSSTVGVCVFNESCLADGV